MRFIDLFAGIGGFRYGLEKSGNFKCVYSNEWDVYASSVYQKHFGYCDIRDICTVNASELPDHDLLVGGFPCQSFSVAGRRQGFTDTRGTLFFEIARIIKEKRPRLLLLENVKGLLSHDQGKTFRIILTTLDELGYNLQWQVLNSKDFGVPQNRERVYIVGHLRGTPRPEVFPFTNTSPESIIQMNHPTHSGRRVYDPKGISPTLNTMQGGDRQPKLFLGRNIVRRLTPLECERLQGFPDNWTQFGELYLDKKLMKMRNSVMSDTQRYKMLGNAVTTRVIEEIGKCLIKTIY